MKIDITSMFFNSKIEGQTATPAWGTSIGQTKSRECRIDDFKPGVIDLVIGMTYKSISDRENLDVSGGSSDREILISSVFANVYINNKRIENAQYTLLLVREHSKKHDGRLIISYAPYIKYKEKTNEDCISLMREALGCSPEGCWFVYDITIKNQSDLYFNAVVVNPTSPMIYSSIKSKNRSEEWRTLIPSDEKSDYDTSKHLQRIFFGAPGTGKSYEIKRKTEGKNVIRTTFHPDSDYSTFVGAYKPTSIEVPLRDLAGHKVIDETSKEPVMDNRIIYEFVEQAFLQAYIKAWKAYADIEAGETPEEQYLVIEEINRGNCAQIFGDLFQLLDRNDYGFSDYPITADKDMKKQLAKAFKEVSIYDAERINNIYGKDIVGQVLSGDILLLPNNLYIWATMNTSDQSLFPIDSAFKRRWDWQYVPIHDGGKGWQIEAEGKRYDWWKFVDAMNDKIGTATYSEDKKLGYFFCKAKDSVIDAETFVGKVVFYIWNDVFKDFAEEAGNLFKDVDGSMLSFNKFYTIGIDGKRKVVGQKIAILMQNLGVEPITTSNSTNDDEPEEDEDGNNPSSYNKNYDKFSVNGEGKWGKNRLPYECMKKYVEMNPGLNADEVLNNWKSLNVNVPHFVESKEEYESRTDNSKRSYYVKCGDTIIYVAHNGYGSNGKVYEFMDAINNANWGIKLAKVMA